MAQRRNFIPGSPFKFSRSKVELFVECPRCFYLDRVKGISRPPGFPFSLNLAVDSLLKKEFDVHRSIQTPHPLVLAQGLDLVPFHDTRMEDWRNNFKGIQATYQGYQFFGAVDDIWVDSLGLLYVVDYKATAKELAVTSLSNEGYHDTYRRQMEFYQWLLRKNGLNVSNTGYFVYSTGDNTQPHFQDVLRFRTHLIPFIGTTDWIEDTLDQMITCASGALAPPPQPGCHYCNFVRESGRF